MRKLLKKIAQPFLVPLTRWYLRKPRRYHVDGFELVIQPGVFHPGLFSSTGILYRYLQQLPLQQQQVLDMGCGSGLLSIAARSRGATVTAVDINPVALANTASNAERNGVDLRLMPSDLFDAIPVQPFDWIVVNPPYYPGKIITDEDFAWKCGEDHDYFTRFFVQVRQYMHAETQVLMVLTQGCDLRRIFAIAEAHGFRFEQLMEKKVLFDEKDFLYRLRHFTSTTPG